MYEENWYERKELPVRYMKHYLKKMRWDRNAKKQRVIEVMMKR